jgi:CMP-N-acetylneuraminic acid synthetase
MAISNHERIGKSLTLLGQGLYPYVEQHMRAIYGNAWLTQAKSCLSQDSTLKRTIEETLREDVSALLTVITRRWEKVFKPNLSHRVNGTVYGEGTGNRRKDAEKQAAADALRKLGLP